VQNDPRGESFEFGLNPIPKGWHLAAREVSPSGLHHFHQAMLRSWQTTWSMLVDSFRDGYKTLDDGL